MAAQSFEYEMGYTPKEFARVLTGNFTGEQSAFRCEPVAENHGRISSPQSDIQINLNIVEQPVRKLGHFSLPVLKVLFSVDAADPAQTRAFFDKFFKYFHKGGG